MGKSAQLRLSDVREVFRARTRIVIAVFAFVAALALRGRQWPSSESS